VSATPIYIGPNNASSVILGNANCRIIANGLLSASNISIINLDTSIGESLGIGNVNARTINLGTSTSTIYCDSKIKGTSGNYSFDISTNHLGFNYTNLLSLITNGYWIQTGTYMLSSVPIGESNQTVLHSLFTPALVPYSGVHYAHIHNESTSPGITFSFSTIENPLRVYIYNPYGTIKTNITFRIIMYCW